MSNSRKYFQGSNGSSKNFLRWITGGLVVAALSAGGYYLVNESYGEQNIAIESNKEQEITKPLSPAITGISRENPEEAFQPSSPVPQPVNKPAGLSETPENNSPEPAERQVTLAGKPPTSSTGRNIKNKAAEESPDKSGMLIPFLMQEKSEKPEHNTQEASLSRV